MAKRLYNSDMDAHNPPPPFGSKPGRYCYTEGSAALVWVEYPWWQRVPWVKLLIAAVTFLLAWFS